jgi:hypothetical protein
MLYLLEQLTAGSTWTCNPSQVTVLPVTVPPVPTPAKKTSTFPCVWAQISGPVDRKCTAGLAGFSNCLVKTSDGSSSSKFSAIEMIPCSRSACLIFFQLSSGVLWSLQHQQDFIPSYGTKGDGRGCSRGERDDSRRCDPGSAEISQTCKVCTQKLP